MESRPSSGSGWEENFTMTVSLGGSSQMYSRPTAYESLIFEVEGIRHYCVANMPGGVPRTSPAALTNATLP